MASSSLTSYTRLSDSLEREILHAASSNNRSYSAIEGLGIVSKAIGRGAAAFGRYLIQVAEALNEARARDARFSGAQW